MLPHAFHLVDSSGFAARADIKCLYYPRAKPIILAFRIALVCQEGKKYVAHASLRHKRNRKLKKLNGELTSNVWAAVIPAN